MSEPIPGATIDGGLVTIKQVSEACQLSEISVYRLIERGVLKSVKIGKSRRVCKESVERLIAHGTPMMDGPDLAGASIFDNDALLVGATTPQN